MARNFVLILIFLYCHLKAALGFLPSWMPGVLSSAPELTRYTRGQTDTLLDVRLSIGLTAEQLFIIDDFQFQLCHDPMEKGDSDIPLPGAHGPRPHLSSGAHSIQAVKDGSFINMEGMQSVEFRDGVWEMIWRDDSPAGLVICGFSLDREARRNDALLQKGQIYLTWPVWSKDGLEKEQALRAKAEMKYKEFESERDSELEKMSSAPNILQKALHFRNAAAAMEKMDFTGLHDLVHVPLAEDVLEIGEGLQMVKMGTVWSKTGSFTRNFRANHQQLLGSATLH
eukprot:CAMPEP_0201884282 /NCGR_PEP_ID=MMETSP0902-20130614/16864_1 /ASSEMBLY_ACC=CAM_ASM_000551 /TAXON_ID=420261 /ORGANISM="Thalassiosira antarctica, Strain CCMP982" /LENGTH=282 /DNA_ID=CAMNT_0048413217 /DNA_START=1 /DNA_END=849 /DNA_ORIENTATION=+